MFDSHFLWYQNRNYKALSDNDIYWILAYVPFYAGMRAATVSRRLPAIKEYFSDFKKVKNYTINEIEEFNKDPRTIHHPLTNEFKIEELINDLRKNIKFKYLKDRTLFHFLTDLGICPKA